MNGQAVKTTLRSGLILLCLCWMLGVPSQARAEPRSIQEFLAFKEKWNDFAVTGYQWQLEGRYAVISDGTLSFVHCALPFRVTEEQANNRGNTGVVEVTGKIIQEEKGLAFQVEKLVSRPRDIDRLKSMRFALSSEKGSDWYKLAEWARGRGAFYSDKDLLAAAVDLDRNGIIVALRQLSPTDEQEIAALLQTAREKRVDETLLRQLMHDVFRARFANLSKAEFSDNALRELQAEIQKNLPGAEIPLEKFSEEQSRQYEMDPKVVYAAADPRQREQLSRLFLMDVALKRILHAAQPDGSNGFRIADQLAQELPERTDLRDKYEALEIAARMKKLEASTKPQLLELTDRLEKNGRQAESTDAKTKWLKAREGLYRQEGARGLADLAQQWISLLGDQTTATRLYIEAWRENPEYTPAIEWLTSHGYRLVDQTWMREDEIAKMPLSPREQAIREGRIETGMTATQVQAALGATPTSATRIASRKQVSEWWVYQEAGIVVKLVKTSRDRESSVVQVDKLPVK